MEPQNKIVLVSSWRIKKKNGTSTLKVTLFPVLLKLTKVDAAASVPFSVISINT